MPSNAQVLTNDRGLAPAMWFEENKKVVVSMPGVPYEMQILMTNRVLPKLKASFPMSPIVHRTILTAGEGETMLAEKLDAFEEKLPKNVKLAYLPSLGTVRLRLTARGEDEAVLNQQLDALKTELVSIVEYAVAGFDDDTLPVVIGRMVKESGLKIGFAESCTGGYMSHLITSVAGSSEYFEGTIVAYAYDLKEKLLNVSSETLNTEGAVSESCITQMVKGALATLNVDVAVAVSGIAGPSGGTPDKPVGTIWLAVADKNSIKTVQINMDRGRAKNMEYAANVGLNLLRKFLLQR
jgi:nicotinamide-nucleotide amidase